MQHEDKEKREDLLEARDFLVGGSSADDESESEDEEDSQTSSSEGQEDKDDSSSSLGSELGSPLLKSSHSSTAGDPSQPHSPPASEHNKPSAAQPSSDTGLASADQKQPPSQPGAFDSDGDVRSLRSLKGLREHRACLCNVCILVFLLYTTL